VLENVKLAPIRRELALRFDNGDAEIFAGVQIEIKIYAEVYMERRFADETLVAAEQQLARICFR